MNSDDTSPAARADFLETLAQAEADRAALTLQPLSGDRLADIAAAEDLYGRIYAAWDDLDAQLRSARLDAGLFPSSADAAELRELERRTGAAERSMILAKARRDRLMREQDELNEWLAHPGWNLPEHE